MDKEQKQICYDYFSGKMDASRASEVLESLKTDPQEFREVEREWKESSVPTYSQVRSFSNVTAQIKSRRNKRIVAAVSTSCCTVALAIGLVNLYINRTEAVVTETTKNVICVVETGVGEKTKVLLPDSTQVWLNASSKLSYNESLFEGERNVELEGEAFFDVTHDADRPFVVKVGDNAIKVLGTKFNVSSYPFDPIVEASLLEGKIEFLTNGAILDVMPGEKVSLDNSCGDIQKIQYDVTRSISWMEEKLDCPSITLDRLLSRVSALCGANIKYDIAEIPTNHFSIILNLKESVPNLLDAVSLVLPINWEFCAEDQSYRISVNNSIN